MLKIKEIRQKRNMSQIELSTKIEISQETISAYENGKAFPSINTYKDCKSFKYIYRLFTRLI